MRSSAKIDELRNKSQRHTIAAVAWVAGLSERTVSSFRNGKSVRPAALKKIQAAITQLKDGLTMQTAPGPLHIDSGKPWQGRTTVKEVTRGRQCGFCGKHHPESLSCA